MTFEEYLSLLPRLSAVKKKILKRLWDEGNAFPRGWVASEELLELTGQKYFDRRVRELRDEMGCNIETGTFNGAHAYRLCSTEIRDSNPRLYLNATQKKRLFERYGYRCAVCDRTFSPGIRGLQADHKVPLNRGGSHEESNWQPLCVECNVGKRRACAECTLNCRSCPWAFPEKVGTKLVVSLPSAIRSSARQLADEMGVRLDTLMVRALREYLKRNG